MADSPMQHLFDLGRLRFYYAERQQFLMPGIHCWTGKRHRWILPTAKFLTWAKGERYA